MQPAYAELHALSNFSFLRGASHPQELVQTAHALGYNGLAITDECSMAGIVRAYEAMKQLDAQRPFQLIIGTELLTACQQKYVLLAPDQAAYSQLCALITTARRRSPKGQYHLTRADLEHSLDRTLALWVASPQANAQQAAWFRNAFPGRGWIAVELHHAVNDVHILRTANDLARNHGLPLVASGDVHMHRRSRRALQDVLTAIRQRCTLDDAGSHLFPNAERRLRSLAELARRYPAPLLLETLHIAERCTFSLSSLKFEYPAELVPLSMTASSHLRTLVQEGARQRWPEGAPARVLELIERELQLIAELRYEHFFLTVHDVVCFARRNNILCQGRGSAANSAVCFALGITEVDPARMQLLFERFISRERNEPPDIDVDFEHESRELVMQYIYDKYGRDRAGLAATVISYRRRSAVRDLVAVLGDDPGRKPLLESMTKQLIGFPRHLSQHVGGFVISGEPLHTLVPVENAAMPNRTVIQWDKDDIETLGLLKVDVLALGILTAIHRSFDLIAGYRHEHLQMHSIPADDVATYDMICRGETVGVFQIESRAQMSMLPRLQPRNFYDLVIEVAIVRPGPIQGNMVHPYLQRRQHPELVTYPSPALKQVLQRTLGVPIFQEQVMQIAVVAADFTPGEADGLRRAMAAWKRRGGLEPWRARLQSGMARNGYSEEFSESIYQQILGFGEYGFPESHAASFALLTYVTSWLRCHEPAAFAAALINSQPMGFYAPAQLTQDAMRNGVTVLPVDVLYSHWDCTLESRNRGEQPALRLGLRLIRGLHLRHAECLLQARKQQNFSGIDDLAMRSRLPAHVLRLLAAAGACRSLSEHRHDAHWQTLGVEQLPPLLHGHSAQEAPLPLPRPTEGQDILSDYRQLGLTTGRHPLALLRSSLLQQGFSSAQDLAQLADGTRVRAVGLVTHMQRPGTASGVVFVSLEDEYGILNLIVWPKVFEKYRLQAVNASLLAVRGTLQRRERVAHVIVSHLADASAWLGGLERRSRDFR